MNWTDEKERWVEIEDFPDYLVSTFGRVVQARFNHILKPRLSANGNLKVALYRDYKAHEKMIHRLVAEAFLENYQAHINIKHKDGDKTNNRPSNLMMDIKDSGVRSEPMSYGDHIKVKRVLIVETGQTFANVENCGEHINYHPSAIYRCLKGERKHVKGYTFEYIWM